MTESRERPLEGLGIFAWKLSLATVIAVAGVVVVLAVRGGGVERQPAIREGAPKGGSATDRAARPAELRAATGRGAAAPAGPDAPVTAVAIEIERLHAAGELAEAQRRFEPCPGGDVRRMAWIDQRQRVRKLIQHRAGGAVVEEWFDGEGALREAVVRSVARGRSWARRITVDERGAESAVDVPAGAVPDEPVPPLVRSHPDSAFFAGAGCDR